MTAAPSPTGGSPIVEAHTSTLDGPPAGRVLHTGQAIVDIVMRVPAMPPLGGDVYARESEFTAGGGFNVMAAAARDQAQVVYLGAHGDGPFGRIIQSALADEGIDVPAAATTGVDTGFCLAMVDDQAERTFVSSLGAEGRVTLDNLTAVTVSPEDVVYVTGYSLCHEHNRAALLAWLPTLPAGVRIVFDPSPLIADIPEEAWLLLVDRAWLWTLNAREAALALTRLGGQAGNDRAHEDSQPDAMSDVIVLAAALDRHVRGRVLLRSGADGAFLTGAEENGAAEDGPETSTGVLHVPGLPVTPVDTNGAGDAHTGVLAGRLAVGEPLAAATRRANIAAAVAVTRPGPATSPSSAEIDALLG